jgi:hypothetical protein
MGSVRIHLMASVVAALCISPAAFAQGLEAVPHQTPPTYGGRAASYQYDDGTAEASVRVTGGGDICWMHSHTVLPGLDRIVSIEVAWGNIPNGSPARVFVWEDPNDDGNPTDAVLIAQQNVVVANANTGVFNVVALSSPPTVTGKFFIGASAVHTSVQAPIPIDRPGTAFPPLTVWYAASLTSFDAVSIPNNTFFDVSTLASSLQGYMLLRANGVSSAGFTYQGELRDAGVPITSAYDLKFSLWTSPSLGVQVGSTLQATVTPEAEGRFTLFLPFAASDLLGTRWLEVQASPAGAGTFSTPFPRQELTPAPFATYALNANWTGLQGIPAGFADGIDNDGGGDITGVTAGTGLTGGATTGNATLNVNFAGTGSANSAARSDHTQAWTTITGVPAGFADGVDNDSGGDITGVTAGTGLSGGATTGNATLSLSFAGNGSASTVSRSDHFHSLLNASDGSPSGVVSIDSAGLVSINNLTTVTDPNGTAATVPALTVVSDGVTLGTYPNLTKQTGLKVMNSAGNGIVIASNTIHSVADSAGLIDSLRINQAGGAVLINGSTIETSMPDYGLSVAKGGISSFSGIAPPTLADGEIYAQTAIGVGTANPAQALDVRGNIALGATGQLLAPGGVENLRILRGRVSSSGAVATGSGFTATRTGTGRFTVTFTTAFASEATVTVSPYVTTPAFAVVAGVLPDSIQVWTFDAAGNAVNLPFLFVATGPR